MAESLNSAPEKKMKSDYLKETLSWSFIPNISSPATTSLNSQQSYLPKTLSRYQHSNCFTLSGTRRNDTLHLPVWYYEHLLAWHFLGLTDHEIQIESDWKMIQDSRKIK